MITHGFDAGEKIDKFAFVTIETTGDFKAPVPQNIQYKLMNAKTVEPKTMPKNYDDSPIVGYYVGDGQFQPNVSEIEE